MRPLEVVRSESRLDALFAKTAGITDIEVQAHWARYLCILVSGYLETSIKEILSEYTRRRADPTVRNYVETQLEWFQNPSLEKVAQLLGAFDKSAVSTIDALDQSTKDAVNSINNNRNSIAHGRNVGIGITTLAGYYGETKKFVAAIANFFQ